MTISIGLFGVQSAAAAGPVAPAVIKAEAARAMAERRVKVLIMCFLPMTPTTRAKEFTLMKRALSDGVLAPTTEYSRRKGLAGIKLPLHHLLL